MPFSIRLHLSLPTDTQVVQLSAGSIYQVITENMAPAVTQRHWLIHGSHSACKPWPWMVEDASTLSWSSAWVYERMLGIKKQCWTCSIWWSFQITAENQAQRRNQTDDAGIDVTCFLVEILFAELQFVNAGYLASVARRDVCDGGGREKIYSKIVLDKCDCFCRTLAVVMMWTVMTQILSLDTIWRMKTGTLSVDFTFYSHV